MAPSKEKSMKNIRETSKSAEKKIKNIKNDQNKITKDQSQIKQKEINNLSNLTTSNHEQQYFNILDHSKKVDLDEYDRKILTYLQNNGRASYRQIAQDLKLAVSTIKNHIERLIKEKVILYIVPKIDCRKLGYREKAIFWIQVDSSVNLENVLLKVAALKELQMVYQISGDYSIIGIARCLERENLLGLLHSIREIEGVIEVRTEIVLQQIKEDMRVRIPGFN